jgi:type I restriction enzyme S subunit
MVKLGDVCTKGSSSITLKDLEGRDGCYPIYGASGFIKNVDFYQQEQPYVAVVKDGAGVGRVMCLPAKSSVIGTMQYIIPNDGVNVKYLVYALEYMNLAKYYTGATIPHIYFKDYCKELLPSHTKEEQEHIATVLNNVEGLIALRKEQITRLEQLIKSRFIELFGDPIVNPYHWDVATIGDIVTDVRYGTSKPAVDGGKYPYLRMNNLTYDGYLDLSDIKYIDIPDNEIEKCIVRKGDILFNRTNSIELVGKTCVFDLDDEMVIAGYIIRVRLNEKLLPIVLSSYMNSVVLKEQLRCMAKGAVNQANINAQELQGIKIYLPPMNLQNQFAAFVEQVDKSKFEIQQSLEKLETLKKSLRMKGF